MDGLTMRAHQPKLDKYIQSFKDADKPKGSVLPIYRTDIPDGYFGSITATILSLAMPGVRYSPRYVVFLECPDGTSDVMEPARPTGVFHRYADAIRQIDVLRRICAEELD